MNPSQKADLKNLTKKLDDNPENMETASKDKNIQNIMDMDNNTTTTTKPKKIIKIIEQINPENIKNLGIADQILAAFRKLDANNDLPPSINIDLTKVTNIKSHKFQIPPKSSTMKSAKSLEPSTSKASIQLFDKTLDKRSKTIDHNNKQSSIIKGTLNKFLQVRQNAKLKTNLLSESTTNKSMELSSEKMKNGKVEIETPKHINKSKSLKSLEKKKIEENLNNEIQEEMLLNSILNDSTEDEQTNMEKLEINTEKNKEIDTNVKKNDIVENWSVYITDDKLISPVKSPVHQKPPNINESILQSTNKVEPKVRILHEMKSEKNIENSKVEQIKITENSINNNSEIQILPNISPLKNDNKNVLLYQNYDDMNDDTKIPSFSDLTSHIIEKWRKESKTAEMNTDTDSNQTEIMGNINILELESTPEIKPSPQLSSQVEIAHNIINDLKAKSAPKSTPQDQISSKYEIVNISAPTSSFARRRKVVPVNIISMKKNNKNIKINKSFTTVMGDQSAEKGSLQIPNINTESRKSSDNPVESLTTKVTVNINGAQITNYNPTIIRKRKVSTTITENPIISYTKIRKILNIEDHKTKENLNSMMTPVPQENFENNSEIINENLQPKNIKSEIKNTNFEQQEIKTEIENADFVGQNNLENKNSSLVLYESIIGDTSKTKDQNEQTLNNFKEAAMVKDEDGVDFLVNLGDSINHTDDYVCNISSDNESSIDSDNSDFYKKFPDFQNDIIKSEIILNEDNNDNSNSYAKNNIFGDNDNNDDDIESPNYESFDNILINNIKNVQQNENELSIINFQTPPRPEQMKPIVIENKILNENEKIDLMYLKNIPHFETPQKGKHEIGQTILLQQPSSSSSEFIKPVNFHEQLFNINESSYMESTEENEDISDIKIDIKDEYNINNEIEDNINNEIITINQDEYIIEEICTSVNDSNQEISNICIIDENIDGNLNQKNNNQNDTEIIQENSMENVNNNLIEYTTKEIDTKYSNIENNEHNKNDLKLNMIKDEKHNLINNDNINICIENLSTDIQLPENLKENKQIPVKSKRMRGGKINLIHRNKQNIIKFDDISKIAKNKETIQIIDEQTLIVPAKETKISLPHESRFSEKSKLTQSISTTTPIINQEILQNNELQEISNTSVNVSNLILKSYHENEPSLEKNLETNSTIFSKNADIKIEKPKNEEILFAVNEQNTKENVKLDKPEENINTNLCSPQQDCSVKNDDNNSDNNSRNSFLNDSLDTDEPFFGFEDTEMCTDIKEAIVENRVSIDENINNNISKIIDAKIIENSFDLIKNNTPENHKNECDKLSINLQDSEKSSIEENVSKLSSDQNKKSQPLLDNSSENNTVNSLNTKFSPITPDKKIPKKLSRKPLLTHKISKTNNKNLNIEETSINNINLDDLSDNSTNIENNTIIIKKLCKRRILDSSSDDNEDITPVKKRSICNSVNNKSIRGETSSMSLTKSEDIRKIEASPTKSKKISKKSDHEKHKSQKSSSKEINLKEICNEKVDNKKIHGESSPVSLSKKEIIKKNELPKKSNKISKENDNEKLILEKPSEINLKEIPNKNETISVNESVKIPKNHKTKIRKKEIHQNTVIDKNITEDEIVSSPRENEIKKEKIKKEEITATDFENSGSVIHQNEIINNSNKIENLNETINFETDISKLDIPTTPTSVGPKKRGRKPKIKENSDVVPVEIQPEILNDSRNKTPRRGRARKGVDRKIHPRLLLIDNRADIDKEDTKVNNDKKILQKNEIQCGMCNEIILKSTWEKHKKNHYGIGWKMDEESIDLSSHCAVLNSLINYFKTVKIKSVTCRLCNKSFGSGLGILTHLEMCGLTEDEKRKQCYIKCEYCGGDFSRYSLPTHLKVCKNLSAKLNINYDEEIKENDKGEGNSDEKNIIIGNTGRLKRQSMIRAEDKFKDFNKNSDFDVGEFIKSVTAVRGGQCRSWKKEIEKNGTATCIGKGCKFKCNTYNEIREHVKICKFLMKSGYRCTRCKYHNDSIDNVRAHILKEHKLQTKDFHNSESEEENYKIENDKSSTDDDMSSGVDENEEENQCAGSNNGVDSDDGGVDDKKTTKIRIRDHNIKSTNKHKKIIDIERTYNDKIQFRNWTQYFYKFNYSNSALFQNFTVNCKPSDKILDLFKPKNNLSMKFSFSKNAEINKKFNSSKPLTEWIEMKIFKSETFKNEQIIYIGGPITSIKWLPIDNDKTIPQYLAITYKRNYNKYIHSINPHRQNTLILIYKVGLTTEFNNNNNNKNLGEFQYGITYENGPIIDMDFLPSGGYIPNINRLGLLAVASTNNDIFIYSLPIKAPQNCDNNNNDLNLIDLNISIQLKLKLLINKNDKSDEIYNVTPTKICWSKAKEHKIIVAGYTNGFIAIWNLTREENLNFMEINEIPTFLPINYFKTSNKSITGLDLHYDSDATRWLIITTIDRTYRILDIEDPSNPIILTEDIAKTFITSTVWPLIWENPCYSTSDELYQSSVQTLNPLIIYYKNRRYSRQSASINDISFNNWYNIMACGGSNGDFSIELNGKMNLDVTQRHEKKLHSYTDLIRLDGNKIDLSLTESVTSFDINFREKYGLIFGPIKYLYKDLTYLQKTRNPPMNMNCYVKINRVASNNNENGNQLYAVGYENGFVRILYINDSNL